MATVDRDQVGEIFGVAGVTVRAWIGASLMPAVNVARPGKRPRYRISEEGIEAYKARCTTEPSRQH